MVRRAGSGRCRGRRPAAGAALIVGPSRRSARRGRAGPARRRGSGGSGRHSSIPCPSARITRSLHRGQAGQGVGFEEVGDAVADPEVDPGDVAAAEAHDRRRSAALAEPVARRLGESRGGLVVDPVRSSRASPRASRRSGRRPLRDDPHRAEDLDGPRPVADQADGHLVARDEFLDQDRLVVVASPASRRVATPRPRVSTRQRSRIPLLDPSKPA